MISVKLEVKEGSFVIVDLDRNITLRDLQEGLCALYKERFPKMTAIIEVQDTMFDEFGDSPFASVNGDEVRAKVTFTTTTDPYFYDFYERRAEKVTLEEEVKWEEEKQNGITDLSLKEWVHVQRAAARNDVALPPPWPFSVLP